MYQVKYVQVLEEQLLRQVREWFLGNDFIFQQNGVLCHTETISMKWFRDNKIGELKWPANSPDMNPIENLWNILKDETYAEPITTKKRANTKVNQGVYHSDKITSHRETFTENMPNRIMASKASKGG